MIFIDDSIICNRLPELRPGFGQSAIRGISTMQPHSEFATDHQDGDIVCMSCSIRQKGGTFSHIEPLTGNVSPTAIYPKGSSALGIQTTTDQSSVEQN